MFKPLIAGLTVLVVSFVIVVARFSGPGTAVDAGLVLMLLRHSLCFWLAEILVVGFVIYREAKKNSAWSRQHPQQ